MWLVEVQETFLRLKIDTEDYIQQQMSAKDKQDIQEPGTESEIGQTESATTSKTIEKPNVGENNQSIPLTMENPMMQSNIPPVAFENTGNPRPAKSVQLPNGETQATKICR